MERDTIRSTFPEFQELKVAVADANIFVNNLEKCSDAFRSAITSIKDHLRKANLLVASLDQAQREMLLKISDFRTSNVQTQVSWLLMLLLVRQIKIL